jgi:hypothetical protein
VFLRSTPRCPFTHTAPESIFSRDAFSLKGCKLLFLIFAVTVFNRYCS